MKKQLKKNHAKYILVGSVFAALILVLSLSTSASARFGNATNTGENTSFVSRIQTAIANFKSKFSLGSGSVLKDRSYISFKTNDGRDRQYVLHVPRKNTTINNAYNNEMPLVIVLHGSYGTGRKMQIGLEFDSYADQYGFMVAYPDAYTEPGSNDTARWNDGRDTLASSQYGIDDVAFMQQLIEHIATTHPVDRSKVFVTGASNGGIMSYRLGCETRGVFRAVAPVIANMADTKNTNTPSVYDNCSPDAPIALLAINGTDDPYIPLEGGEVCKSISKRLCEGGYVASRDQSVAKFLAANNCNNAPVVSQMPTTSTDPKIVEKSVYSCSTQANGVKNQVITFTMNEAGHVWAPKEPQLGAGGESTQNLDATKEIVNFFVGMM